MGSAVESSPSRGYCACCAACHFSSSSSFSSSGYSSFFFFWIVICLLAFSCVTVKCQNAGDYTTDENSDRGLFPPTFNLASGALITANATCGEDGEERFCKLVEHVREPQCGICDSRSPDPSRRHPITYAIDGTQRWWQSPSLQNGRQYEWVTITLDLRQVYQVAYVIVKAANSPRPGNWILERSLDGETFKPWQYYAITNSECLYYYGIPPTIGIPRYRSDDEVICTSRYSQLEPLEHGEIHTSLVKGRPGVTGPSDKLLEFTAARYIRLRLQKIRTLHADLMTVTTENWEKVHRTVTRRLFYSIKDISIGGQCMCFGHAKDCPSDPVTRRLRCRCVHNTCGDSCEKCCPLYNQYPWRVGTSEVAGICAKCQCYGHADECYYNKEVAARRESINIEGKYDGGGVCVNCRDFTTGNNCEKCLEGYYRPLSVPPDALQPCLRCVCEGVGTMGYCIRDDTRLAEGLKPGDCVCKEGFAGPRCSRCAIGYRNFPICDLCPCNFAGTVNTDCEGECLCKPNVDGVRCDRCKPGHFNLDEQNPRGCTECYCFGITTRCVSANLGVQIVAPRKGWQVSDVLGQKVIRPFWEADILTVANDDMIGYDAYYWLAPDNFTGNLLRSYGGRLHFNVSWVKARGDSAGWPTRRPTVILDGGGMMIAYDERKPRKSDCVVESVVLSEDRWFHLLPDVLTHKKAKKTDHEPVNRQQFMAVLFTLDRVLIQAKFHTDQIVGKLYTASLEMGSETVPSLNRLRNVEKCFCPPGYAGLSCESCERGYRRVNGTAHQGECRECDCNRHVDTCDPYTGECQECLHNTTGDRCERCKDSFYGDPTRGTPQDCRPCLCPLDDPRNRFSQTCVTVIADDTGFVDYVCTDCPVGYEGNKCDKCSDGFFGNPLIPGNYCQSCNCHGHLDPNVYGNCDPLTGRCLRCTGNTMGWFCDQCLEGFFGNPLEGDCEPCKCNLFGSASGGRCVNTTGECECLPRYTRPHCDRCIENYGNVAAGCVPCNCNLIGSQSSTCDAVSGLCECKPGVFGTNCDTCRDGYYDFSDSGCKWCVCHPDGSRFVNCTLDTGQCWCWPNVGGRTCDQCETGFWNLLSVIGCEPCTCNTTGSLDVVCDQNTGQCSCKPGVGGLKCDRCLPGYFGMSDSGCRTCDPCDVAGHICDPFTGECVCPPFTQGRFCTECQTHTWGYDLVEGCKPCNCSYDGSTVLQCNPETGICHCREGYEGSQCNRCRFGYFDFPKCKRCKCHKDGTDPTKCQDGHCECNETGQCPCRVNVDGKKCRRCKMGTFGWFPVQREGCFECFCFGKSTQCTPAEYTWTHLPMPEHREITMNDITDADRGKGGDGKNLQVVGPVLQWITAEICYINLAHPDSREVTMEKHESSLYIINGLRVIPGTTGNVDVRMPSLLDAPLYWRLPNAFTGDKVLSYNGHLTFTVKVEGGSPFPDAVLKTYPLVQLQGNFRLILEYYPKIPAPDGRYQVRFHEDFWKVKNNHESRVNRATMMVALQNIQHLLIRATDRSDFVSARLENLTLDVAVPAMSISPVMTVGIEICVCPPQYNGTSCQDPADGYYRKRKKDFLNSKDILDLVGFAHPCECNNRSRICDKETGFCHNCQDNTDGAYCEKCALGFYGDPSKGQCLQCACPSIDNSFSDTCELDEFGSIICTKCKEGYTGNRCQSCIHGYYGDPLLSGGSCKPCACDLRGSLGNMCHPQTGQCVCLEGLTGRDCSQCTVRHVLTDYGCQTCDDECTGLLLNDLESLKSLIASANVTGIDPAPWGQLYTLNNTAVLLQRQVALYEDAVKHGEMLIIDFDSTFNLKEAYNKLFLKAKELAMNASAVMDSATMKRDLATDFLQDTLRLQHHINETVQRLVEYARGVKNASVNIEMAIAEAEEKLEDIRSRDFIDADRKVNREHRKAQALLEMVKKMIFSPTKLRGLEEKLRKLKAKLDDILHRLLKAGEISTNAEFLNENNMHRLQKFKDFLNLVENVTKEIAEIKEEGGYYLNNAMELLEEANQNFLQLQVHENKLLNLSYYLEAHLVKLAQLLPQYKWKYVDPAVEWADKLLRNATYLNELFNSTKNESGQAMKAVRAYQDIADELHEAHKIAIEANDIAMSAYSQAFPDTSPSLLNQVHIAVDESKELRKNAKLLQDAGISGLRDGSLKQKDNVQKLNNTNLTVKKEFAELLSEMNSLKTGVRLPPGFDENISQTEALVQNAIQRTEKVVQKVKSELQPAFAAAEAASKEGVGNLTKKVTEAERTIKNLNDRVQMAEDKVNSYNKMAMSFKNKLEEVRNSVLRSRHVASSIMVSISGNNGQCVRRLRHQVKPSATNTISFIFSSNTTLQNSLLFYMGSAKHKDKALDFMAVEIVNSRVRFLWNAGANTAVIEHPLVLKLNDDVFKSESRWYMVNIERIGSVAKLSVHNTSYETPVEFTNHSNLGHEQIDFGDDALFYIGGIPPQLKAPAELRSRNFYGCLFSLKVDNEVVGLWDFVCSSNCTVTCTGCKEGPVDTPSADGGISFNGRGYALPEYTISSRANPSQLSIVFRVKTYSEDALLVFCLNNDTNGFVLVTLEEGKIVYMLRPDNSSTALRIVSEKKYNSGNWTTITIRFIEGRWGQLTITTKDSSNEPVKVANFSEAKTHRLTLKTAQWYIGGVPPDFPKKRWANITLLPYRGCFNSLQIDNKWVDFNKAQMFGVSAGCRKQVVNSFTALGDGYTEMPGYSIDRNTSFGLTFESAKSDGLLMISTFLNTAQSKRVKDFYSLALKDGFLHFRFGAMETRQYTTDKSLLINASHFIFVSRMGNEVKLRINDTIVYSTTVPSGKVITSPFDEGLFFAGVPSAIRVAVLKQNQVITTAPFEGVIRDVVFNYELLDFARVKKFTNVSLGLTKLVVRPPTPPNDTASTKEPERGCIKPPQINLAITGVKLGDAPNSLITMDLKAALDKRNFEFVFEFRTFYPYGLLFLVQRGGKGQHYFAMNLINGHIEMVINESKKKKIILRDGFHDGQWHMVTVTKKSKRLMLSMGRKNKSISTPGKLNVMRNFYMGGLPSTFRLKSQTKLRRDPFRGCIRDFKIDGQPKDLSPNAQNVGHCFLKVEAGTRFGGDGYVIFADRFFVGSKMDLEIEFRTTEMEGVLLSVSERNNAPALALELYNGDVVMSVDVGDHKVARQSIQFNSSGYVCDNRWHIIKASYSLEYLSLRVDKSWFKNTHIESTLQEIRTNSPLYIGGLPDDAPAGVLHSRANFKGCIRNLVIQEQRRDWTDMAKRIKVQLNSCEVQ